MGWQPLCWLGADLILGEDTGQGQVKVTTALLKGGECSWSRDAPLVSPPAPPQSSQGREGDARLPEAPGCSLT